MVAGRSGGDKTRRKHRAKKRSKERSVRAGMEMHGSRGMKFAERETTESGCLAGKENCPERYEAMAVSGDLKPLPCRDLRLERGDLR